MTDYSELKRLAEAFPAGLDWDSNTEPFFNGPSGESLGGGSTGFYSVYGKPFEIDGDTYDGNEYVPVCTKEFAKFVCLARDGVLALIADNEALRRQLETTQRGAGELAKNAERYEWLRAQHWDSSAICCVVDPKLCTKLGSYCPSLELLDQAVDAGLKLSKESPNG